MPVAAAIAGAAVVGAGASIYSAKKAAKAQRKAAESAAAQQERMYQRQEELQQPFREGGMAAQQQIMNLLGIGPAPTATAAGTPAVGAPAAGAAPSEFGSLARPFGMDQFQADPGYAFRQAEGMRALERSAAARGNLLSGSTLKGIQRFGQDLASQEYGNAFNRYQIERAARLNPLQSLMGSGQSAANVMTGAAGQLGQGLAQSEYNIGAARASGYVGAANALNQALGSVANYAVQAPMYNAMTNYYNRSAGMGGGIPWSEANPVGIGGVAYPPGSVFGSGAAYPGGPMSYRG